MLDFESILVYPKKLKRVICKLINGVFHELDFIVVVGNVIHYTFTHSNIESSWYQISKFILPSMFILSKKINQKINVVGWLQETLILFFDSWMSGFWAIPFAFCVQFIWDSNLRYIWFSYTFSKFFIIYKNTFLFLNNLQLDV